MDKKREPHEKMTTKSNELSSTQEVLYQQEFKKADSASKENTQFTNDKNKS